MLLCRCADLEDGLPLILEALSTRDRHCVQVLMGWNLIFRGCNPTGHYELNLSLMPHRMLAQRLKDQSLSEGDQNTWLNVAYVLDLRILVHLRPVLQGTWVKTYTYSLISQYRELGPTYTRWLRNCTS